MNINTFILYLTIFIIISVLIPKLNCKSCSVLLSFFIIGYGITRDIPKSAVVSLFITYTLILLNDSTATNSIKENFKTKKNKKRKKNKKIKKENFKNDDTGESFSDGNDTEDFIDTQKSFINTYKKMTPRQVKGLNKDTQSLIKTQKQLINTLNSMGPSIKESRNILDTFKNYFGKDINL